MQMISLFFREFKFHVVIQFYFWYWKERKKIEIQNSYSPPNVAACKFKFFDTQNGLNWEKISIFFHILVIQNEQKKTKSFENEISVTNFNVLCTTDLDLISNHLVSFNLNCINEMHV